MEVQKALREMRTLAAMFELFVNGARLCELCYILTYFVEKVYITKHKGNLPITDTLLLTQHKQKDKKAKQYPQ